MKTSAKDLGTLTTKTVSYTHHVLEVVESSNSRPPVWNLGLLGDTNMIVKMHKKFFRHVTYQYNIEISEIQSDNVGETLSKIDKATSKTICKHRDKANQFTFANTRTGVNIHVGAIAAKEIVNMATYSRYESHKKCLRLVVHLIQPHRHL